ncbi:MAG: hypothetical protein AAGA06_07575 [Pseudomonadota bacterium]
MWPLRIFALGLVLSSVAFSTPAAASDCTLRNRHLLIDEGALFRFLRCLTGEVNALRRENQALKRRVAALEEIAGEVPATFSNFDGQITRVEGRVIARASFVLSARSTGGPSALPLDQDVVETLCARDGGCSVTVGFRQMSLFGNDPKNADISGPCQFTYDAGSGDWSVGEGCEGGKASGRDGGTRTSAQAGPGDVIASSLSACVLAESAPARSVGSGGGGFENDHARGLFLVSRPSQQPDGITRFQCELLLN